MLVRAFDDDPVIRWVFPDDAEARRLYFRTNLELGHPHGAVFTAEAGLGCAIWAPPGEWRVSLWTQLFLVPRIIRMLGVRRFQRGMMVFDRLQKEHQAGPHYYLGVLGVDPSCPGARARFRPHPRGPRACRHRRGRRLPRNVEPEEPTSLPPARLRGDAIVRVRARRPELLAHVAAPGAPRSMRNLQGSSISIPIMPSSACSRMWQWNIQLPGRSS